MSDFGFFTLCDLCVLCGFLNEFVACDRIEQERT